MKIRRLSYALACASMLSIAAVSTQGQAQRVTRIVVFGDSYADTGNAFALGYANPQALAVYPTGRFSGGSNYIDTLANTLQVPVQNFAIGGAMGGTNNGTLCFDPVYGSALCGKGLQYEVDQFLNVGTQSAVFPNATTTFTRSDLLAISIGGNDARIYQQGGGPLATAAAAGALAGTNTGVQISRLLAQGTPTISFLALNGAVAPEVANNPAAQAIRGTFSTAYYASVQPALAAAAANGSIVHYLDGQVLAGEIAANPAAYGITNGLVCPIFPNTTCLVNSNGYLFYGDALHLTSQGFAIIAQYVGRQLAAPLTLQAPSDMGLDVASHWGRTLSTRTDLYSGDTSKGLRLYLVGDGFSHDAPMTDTNNAFEVRSTGASIGAEYGLPNAMVGVAANYSRPKVRFGTGDASVRAHSWQVGAYGSASVGGLSGSGYLGYGHDTDKITRTGVVEGMTANPHGNHTVAGAKGGYLMSFGGLKAGPIVALDYAKAKVDSYVEAGDPALTLNVSGQSAKSLTGQAGLELRGDISGLHPYVDVTAEHEFSGDGRLITFSQTSAPVIVNSWNVSGQKQTYGRISGGAFANIGNMLSVDLAASTTLSRKGGNELGGHLGVKARF